MLKPSQKLTENLLIILDMRLTRRKRSIDVHLEQLKEYTAARCLDVVRAMEPWVVCSSIWDWSIAIITVSVNKEKNAETLRVSARRTPHLDICYIYFCLLLPTESTSRIIQKHVEYILLSQTSHIWSFKVITQNSSKISNFVLHFCESFTFFYYFCRPAILMTNLLF